MKNIILLLVVLVICAGIIYWQQLETPEPMAVNSETMPVAQEGSSSAAIELPTSASASDARVFIISPDNGATVSSPVQVKFGIENMNVSPAGVDAPNSGHHHLLINMDELPDLSAPLPATESLIHFGGGQTETTIELPSGTHTLQLVLGNYLHIPHTQPVVSEKITITVE